MTQKHGLKDDQWIQVQQKAFTRWMNAISSKNGFTISDITTEFEDGIKLVRFMEALSHENIPKYNKVVKHKMHKIENLNKALDFIKAHDIQLVNIGAEDVQRGDLKLILGLVWLLILRFQVNDISEGQLKAKEALLLWCQKKTKGYKNVNVHNFTTSFKDGLAFCALIHAHRPNLIDYNKCLESSPLENLKLAFDVVEQHLGIARLLDPEDIVDAPVPDEKAIVAYVSMLYHVFNSDRENETAARRLRELLDMFKEIEDMQNQYKKLSSDLLDWINAKTVDHKDRNYDNTLEHIKELIKNMVDYKNGEKLEKAKEKDNLETLLNSINIKLRSNNRPPFIPDEGLTPDALNSLWDNLVVEEGNRDEWLDKERRRQERLKLLNSKFNDKASKLEQWIKEKEKYLTEKENVSSIADAKNKLARAEGFTNEYKQSEPRLKQVNQLGEEIISLQAKNSDEVRDRMNKINTDWKELDNHHKNKVHDLKEQLKLQEEMERLRLLYSNKVQAYNKFIKGARNDVSGREFGDNLKDVLEHEQKLDASDSKYNQESEAQVAEIEDIWNQLQNLGVTTNRYCSTTFPEVKALHSSLQSDIGSRRNDYNAEKQRQLDMEEKRKEFAELANKFVEQINNRKNEIESYNTEPDPSTLKDKIVGFYAGGQPENDSLKALSALANEMAQMGIRDNSHTKHTLPSLTVQNKAFVNEVRIKLEQLRDEERLKEEYKQTTKKLLKDVEEVLPSLDRKFDNTLDGAKKVFFEWNSYKSGLSAELVLDRENVKSIKSKIDHELEKFKRPAFVPPEGLQEDDINRAIQQLQEAEEKVDNEIRKELERQERIAKHLQQYNTNFKELESFIQEKENAFQTQEQIKNLNDVKKHLRILDHAKVDVHKREPLLQQIVDLSGKLNEEDYKDKDDITHRTNEIKGKFENLTPLREKKESDLKGHLSDQEKKESIRLSFAEAARDLQSFVDKALPNAKDHYFGNSLSSVEEFEKELVETENRDIEEVNKLYDNCANIDSQLKVLGVEDNKHTSTNLPALKELKESLVQALNERRHRYKDELSKQKQHDQRRQEFAGKSKEFVDWIENQGKAINEVSGSTDEQLAKVNDLYKPEDGQERIKELETVDQQNVSDGIFGNNHTALTVPILKARNKQYDQFVQNTIESYNEDKRVEAKQKELEEEFARRDQIDELTNNLETKKGEILYFIDTADEYNSDDLSRFNSSELDSYVKEYESFMGGLDKASTTLSELQEIENQLVALNVENTNVAVVKEKFDKTKQDIEARKTSFATLKNTLLENEQLLKNFAEHAQNFFSFIEVQKEKEKATTDDLEVTVKILKEVHNVLESNGSEKLEELEKIDENIKSRNIFENPFTQYSVRSLKNNFESFLTSNTKKLETATTQLEAKNQTGITTEQYAEFKEAFQHFDKDNDSNINVLEFFGVLKYLGEQVTEESAAELLQKLDSNGDGLLSWDEFKNYIIAKKSDKKSVESYLEAFQKVAGGKNFITVDDLQKAGFPDDKIAYFTSTIPKKEGLEGGIVGYDFNAWLSKAHGK